jgi:hypothetical protein
MSSRHSTQASNFGDSRAIGDLDRAAAVRRKTVWDLTMSERLARMHALCKQMSAVNGTARAFE